MDAACGMRIKLVKGLQENAASGFAHFGLWFLAGLSGRGRRFSAVYDYAGGTFIHSGFSLLAGLIVFVVHPGQIVVELK